MLAGPPRSPQNELHSRWRPLLAGNLRERAVASITSIADRIPELLPQKATQKPSDASLGAGRAGLALFYAYLHQGFPGAGYEQLADRLLKEAIETLSSVPMPPAFYGGFTGIAWAAERLRPMLYGPNTEDLNEEIDTALFRSLDRPTLQIEYDLVRGLVGLGVYALARLPRPTAQDCLGKIVDHLNKRAVRTAGGIAWWTLPGEVPEQRRAAYPKGYHDLGVAHGVPGVVAFLAEAAGHLATRTTSELLYGAVPWLLYQKLPNSRAPLFPYCVAEGLDPKPARLAWCYGDLGIAVALLRAARYTDEPAWESEALAIARASAKRLFASSSVADASLCHGAAGVSHLFNRLYQATGEESFREAALAWLERTLAYQPNAEGIPTFPTRRQTLEASRSIEQPGILEGNAGVGLALLAAISSEEPAWDQMLLSSIP